MGNLPRSQSAACARNVPHCSRDAATATAAATGRTSSSAAAAAEPLQPSLWPTAPSEDGGGVGMSCSSEIREVQPTPGGARRQADGSGADPGSMHAGSEWKANGGRSKHSGRGPIRAEGPGGAGYASRGEEPESKSMGTDLRSKVSQSLGSKGRCQGRCQMSISDSSSQQKMADDMLVKQDQIAHSLRPGTLHMTSLERMFAHLGSSVREVERKEALAVYTLTNEWVPPLTEAPMAPGLHPRFLNMLDESSSYHSKPKLATVGGYVRSSTAIQKALYSSGRGEEAAADRKKNALLNRMFTL